MMSRTYKCYIHTSNDEVTCFISSTHPQTYVPTVFENYTAGLELEEQRVELSLWDTSGERDNCVAEMLVYITEHLN